MENETLPYTQDDNPVGMYVRLPGEIQKSQYTLIFSVPSVSLW